MKLFFNYFNNTVEYPRDFAAGEILPIGTLYGHISSTFLNGCINYTNNIQRAYVACRYLGWDEPSWRDDSHTKLENYERVLASREMMIINDLSCLEDDIIVLTKQDAVWWFYWFDCDTSNCMIGRFKTADDDETVIHAFDMMVTTHEDACRLGDAKVLPRTFFDGWASF